MLNENKSYIFIVIFLLQAFSSFAQTPLNGRFYITGASEVPSTTGSDYSIEGNFIDPLYIYNASDVIVGDMIADFSGLIYKIDKITKLEGNQITVDVTYLSGATSEWFTYPASYQIGTLFRPTEKGYPMVTYDPDNTNDNLKIAIQNAAIIAIDNDIRGIKFGTSQEIPKDPKLGELFYNTEENKLYIFDGTNWNPFSGGLIPSGPRVEFPDPAKTGELFFNTDDNSIYIYGDIWFKVSTNGSNPNGNSNPKPTQNNLKPGNLFFNTSDNRLYVFNGSAWIPLDNSLPEGRIYIGSEDNVATPVFMSGDATIAGDGVLTISDQAVTNDKLDKVNIPLSGFGAAGASVSLGDGTNNFTIINLADPVANQDAATKAYVDSKIAETTIGDILPTNPNVGDVFYNTSDSTLYVFDGTVWSAIGSGANGGGAIIDLPKDMFYIGDVDNKAAPIAKINIPLSGFGGAQDTLIMDNYRITKLANPIYAEDAATKAYVDTKTTNAGNALPTVPKRGDTFFNTDDNRLYFYNGTDWVSLDNTLLQDQFYIGDAKNKAVSVEKLLIPISGFGTAIADISLGNGTNNYKITNLGTPIDEFDAVPKGYVDNILDGVTNGYMERAIYDSNQDSVVDVAATVNGFTVESNVPSSAVFTDDLVKIGVDGTPLYLSENDFEVDASASEIILKKLDFSKFDAIADSTLLGNNLGADASPIPLTAGEVRSILELDKVDNTADEDKHVFSAGRIYPPIKINGEEFDGSSDINLGDDLGNHTATENIKTGDFSISNDGESGKGLSFDVAGNAVYAQDLTVNGNFYTPSDQRLKTNIETLTAALESLDQLRGVRFEYLDQKKYMTGPKVGLVAQELRKVYPEMVSHGIDGFLKVDYTQLSAVLIQAVKEQQQQLRAQAQEIEELKKRMDKQEDQLNNILQKLTE